MENEVLSLLKQVKINLNYKRPNMSGEKYRTSDRIYGYGIRSVTLGLIRNWKTGKKTLSKFTLENESLYKALQEYGKSITNIPFNSIF